MCSDKIRGFMETRIIPLDVKSSDGVCVGGGQPWGKKLFWIMHLERIFPPSCPAITAHRIILTSLDYELFENATLGGKMIVFFTISTLTTRIRIIEY